MSEKLDNTLQHSNFTLIINFELKRSKPQKEDVYNFPQFS